MQIRPFCPRRWIHVCRSGSFAHVVSLFHCHGCRLWVSAPVVLHGCCPELRQGPAQLRVLRNSPRAMPLSGLPIIVMSARYTSRKQGKLQRACACKCHVVHGCRSGSFALVIPLSHCYVYRLGLSAPVVLYIDLHGCRSWVFAPRRLILVCRSGPSAPVGLHGCCPELRQEPAQLRVLHKRNSSGKASSDAGPELAGRAAERRWKARRP